MILQAGAAAQDICPARPMSLFGYPHTERVSIGVHDPISASAVYLASETSAAVLISLELLFLSPPHVRAIRRQVAERLEIEESGVFISCTHTHSAPVSIKLLGWKDDPTIPGPDREYLNEVTEKTVQAAQAAKEAAVDAELAWTTADATSVGGNRLDADGVTDPEVGILAVRRASDQQMIAVSITYGMHPTVMHEDSKLISADFPFYTAELLRQQYGSDVTVLYQMAPSGNQSPRYYVTGQTFDEAERLGRKLGEAVHQSISQFGESAFRSDVEIQSELCEVELPRRRLPDLAEAEQILADYHANYERLKAEGGPRPAIRTAECAIFGAEGTRALAEAQKGGQIDAILDSYAPHEVQVIQIGNAHLVGFPGEMFTEFALEVKRRTKAKGLVFVVSLVNGELQGYLVTPEAAAEGGYEATNSLFAPEGGMILVNKAVKMISG